MYQKFVPIKVIWYLKQSIDKTYGYSCRTIIPYFWNTLYTSIKITCLSSYVTTPKSKISEYFLSREQVAQSWPDFNSIWIYWNSAHQKFSVRTTGLIFKMELYIVILGYLCLSTQQDQFFVYEGLAAEGRAKMA